MKNINRFKYFIITIIILVIIMFYSHNIYIQSITINFQKLESHLAKKEWEYADSETSNLLNKIVNKHIDTKKPLINLLLDFVNLGNSRSKFLYEEGIPCNYLNYVDLLWSKYSDSRFGFNSQVNEVFSGLTQNQINSYYYRLAEVTRH